MKKSNHRRKKQKGIVDKYCLGCRYLIDLTWGESPDTPDRYCCCDYICQTGKRRPCPAGSGCTVRTSRQPGGAGS